jgi:hypothetical protein
LLVPSLAALHDRRDLLHPNLSVVAHCLSPRCAFYPHVHCIVTGGGLALDGSRWVSAPGEFLFPVRVLGALFRGKVLDGLARARRDGKLRLAPEDEGRVAVRRTDALHRASWCVTESPVA